MTNNQLDTTTVSTWLQEKVATRLEIEVEEVSVDTYFDDFGLDSTEALVLAGELEKWLGFELPGTALWYHPTIRDLSEYIVEVGTGVAE